VNRFFSDQRFEYRTQARWARLVFGVLFLIIGGRFFHLQIIKGHEFERLSQVDQIRPARIKARRGAIFDRAKRKLASNLTNHKLFVIPGRIKDPVQTVRILGNLLHLPDKEKSHLLSKMQDAKGTDRFERVYLSRDLNGERCPEDGNELELQNSAHKHYWCPDCGRSFEIWDRGESKCSLDNHRLKVRGEGRIAHCTKCGMEYLRESICPYDSEPLKEGTASLRCRICGQLYSDEVAMVNARRDELPGVYITTGLRRDYPYGSLASIIVGYVNEANAKEVHSEPEIYRPGDHIGRRGVERALESDLRGQNGEYMYLRRKENVTTNDTEIIEFLQSYNATPATNGNDIYLTIDLDIQKVLEDALAPYPAAAAVVIHPGTGAIMGMYSRPTFNANHWSNSMTRETKLTYDENPYAPMMDRTSSSYPPGSVYKVITALAALDLGIAAPEDLLECPGYYEFAGRRFRCHKRSGHGPMNLHDAIVRSCDVYFYRVAELIGMNRLHDYAKDIFMMGIGTGIETGESQGWIPSREEYFKGRPETPFMPGWTLSTGIGQGNVLLTPLQVAQLYATVANDGNIPRLYLIDRILDEEGSIVRKTQPEMLGTLPFSKEYMDNIKHALYDVVHHEDGTGKLAMLDEIIVAGKTGTSEAKEYRKGASPVLKEWLKRDHAWFAGYAPATRPEVVVVVLLEHGGSGGKEAAPLFRRIVGKIFDRRLNVPYSRIRR
jgi:penicillin-binding protein 2